METTKHFEGLAVGDVVRISDPTVSDYGSEGQVISVDSVNRRTRVEWFDGAVTTCRLKPSFAVIRNGCKVW